tara:strand:+ start:41 stop:757 length:717 start_codon:yes stop_codon:yes gene_type:complete
MRDILKSILFSFYYIKVAKKNYLPFLLYLALIQIIQNYLHDIMYLSKSVVFIELLFTIGFFVASSPIVINISRSIINDEVISNEYISYINKTYAKLYIKKLFYLLAAMIIICIVHIMILAPFIPNDDPQKVIILGTALMMYMIYIYTRIMFILPAAAINISLDLKDSFNYTKGFSTKIYFLYIAIIIPYILLSLLIIKYNINTQYLPVSIIISIILQLFLTTLSSSLIAYIYKRLIKN